MEVPNSTAQMYFCNHIFWNHMYIRTLEVALDAFWKVVELVDTMHKNKIFFSVERETKFSQKILSLKVNIYCSDVCEVVC